MSEPTTDHSHAARSPRSGTVTRVLAGAAIVVVALLGVLFTTVGRDSGSAPAGGEALSIPLATPEGGTTTLGELRGEPLVVNFFASWCPPCRLEMPDLERAHQQAGDDVRFLGVSVDYDESTWRSFVAESGITYDTVFEPRQDLLRAVGGAGMPTTVLIDADGTIAHVHTGILDDEALLRLIDEKLPT